MPTIEERLQALEQEHTQLKKTIELQTIAIGALVNKTTLEKLNEKYDKIFDALMAHDRFSNQQLAELRTQQIETDGKVAGLQTEMRQRFNQQDGKVAGLQTEMRQHFNQQDGKVAGLQTMQAEQTTHLSRLETKFDEQTTHLSQLETKFDEQTKLLTQILERISKNDR